MFVLFARLHRMKTRQIMLWTAVFKTAPVHKCQLELNVNMRGPLGHVGNYNGIQNEID